MARSRVIVEGQRPRRIGAANDDCGALSINRDAEGKYWFCLDRTGHAGKHLARIGHGRYALFGSRHRRGLVTTESL